MINKAKMEAAMTTIENFVDKHNRIQDEKLMRKFKEDSISEGIFSIDDIKFVQHQIPKYPFDNDTQITKIKDHDLNTLNASAKNLVTSIEIFQQGSDRKKFSISLTPNGSTGAFIEQRLTTVEEERSLLYKPRDSNELATAGAHGYIRAEKSIETNDGDFFITGSLQKDGQYQIGNLHVLNAKMFNCFVVLFGEVARKSSVWNLVGMLEVNSIDLIMTNTGDIEIKIFYGELMDTAVVETKAKTKIVALYKADGGKCYFDINEPENNLEKAIGILVMLVANTLEDTEFFINTIGTKRMFQRQPLTFGFNSPTLYASTTLEDLLKHSKRKFVVAS